MNIKNIVLVLSVSALLLACGGGGGDDSGTETSLASVNAGTDQSVNERNSFTLTAVADPTGGSFSWRQLTGTTLTGMPATTASVTLTAPTTKTELVLAFQVSYTSPSGLVRTDEVQVKVLPVNTAPVAVAQLTKPSIVPVALGQQVELSAASSYDPDADGSISSYSWQQVSGPTVVLAGASSKVASFTAPLVSSATDLGFKLTVTDDENSSHSTEIKVPVRASSTTVYAYAGADQQVREFSLVQLDGSGSQSSAGSFSCSWSQVRGQSLVLQNANQCLASFIAPDVAGTSEIELRLTVTDSASRQATDTVIVSVVNAVLGSLPDTGMTECYDLSAAIPCGNAAFPRQDADHGRDAVIPYLRKIGRGEHAFDFTKLDENGDEVSDDATDFSCVRDNVTGLIWELKEPVLAAAPNTTLRAANNRYSFVNSAEGNGDVAGVAAPAQSSCPSASDCGTQTFVDEVNAAVYCGGSNWRLPTLIELMSLADFSRRGQAHLLDPSFFRYEPALTLQNNLYYWTSETSAEGGGGISAWVFNIQNGNDNSLPKQVSQLGYVRLVRSP
ncbi:DUF1566 domain-containing protein [Rheinheimera marina]|uniref:DUF1566 domain-containing protein n=1 Tax=Rheinheimera marina TaxID=1774958 RepID=A0ABV9JK35_9GAMM